MKLAGAATVAPRGHGKTVWVRSGRARNGKARRGLAVEVWRGELWHGLAGSGEAVPAGHGVTS